MTSRRRKTPICDWSDAPAPPTLRPPARLFLQNNPPGTRIKSQLDGRLALVTGSSAGIGLGVARGLAQAGAAVVLNGREVVGASGVQQRGEELELAAADSELEAPPAVARESRGGAGLDELEVRAQRAHPGGLKVDGGERSRGPL